MLLLETVIVVLACLGLVRLFCWFISGGTPNEAHDREDSARTR